MDTVQFRFSQPLSKGPALCRPESEAVFSAERTSILPAGLGRDFPLDRHAVFEERHMPSLYMGERDPIIAE
jgi:hypothetical protein